MADNDDDFDLDLDDDDIGSGESGVPAPTDYDDEDFDFDDDFDELDGEKKGKLGAMLAGKRKLLMLVGTVIAGVGLIGFSTWYMFFDESGQEGGQLGSAVGMALEREAQKGIIPPKQTLAIGAATGAGAKLATGAASKLTSGAAQQSDKLTAAAVGASAGALATKDGMGGYDPKNAENPLSTAAVADVGINIPAVLPNAFRGLGDPKAPQALPAPSDQSLMEVTDVGLLPTVSPEGKQPWSTYARPFQAEAGTPIVALVVTGLGMSSTLTQASIDHLPYDVTLAFGAYGVGTKQWAEKAREMGHETLLELPMEADSFPADDPGPMALKTDNSPTDNLQLLNQLMMKAQGYVGFMGRMGSKFLKDERSMAPVLGELKTRGLMFVDPRSVDKSVTLEMADQIGMARAIADMTIDTDASPEKIRAQLDTLSTLAKNRGATVGMMHATPNAIKVVKEWAAGLGPVKIAPISILVGQQKS